MRPDISIVIPIYRPTCSAFANCLDSISRQIRPNYSIEVVLAFDGPPSSELEQVALHYSSSLIIKELRLIHKGVSSARNKGLAAANGSWVMFVDADDSLPDGACVALLNAGRSKSADIVFGDFTVEYPSGLTEYKKGFPAGISSLDPCVAMHQVLIPDKSMGLVWGKIFSSNLLKSEHLEFDPALAVGEDTLFVFNAVAKARTIGYCSKPVYNYRRGEGSAVTKFREDYPDRIVRSMNSMKTAIQTLGDDSWWVDFNSYVLFHLLLINVHYIFNPNSGWVERQRRKEFFRILSLDIFDSALKDYRKSDFPITKLITLKMLRSRLYFACRIICAIRNWQLKG